MMTVDYSSNDVDKAADVLQHLSNYPYFLSVTSSIDGSSHCFDCPSVCKHHKTLFYLWIFMNFGKQIDYG